MATVVKSDLAKFPVAEESSVHIPSGRAWLEGELEPGKLAEVARLAAAWFRRHVSPGKTPADVEEPLDISVRGE
jgi:hypothetical protein